MQPIHNLMTADGVNVIDNRLPRIYRPSADGTVSIDLISWRDPNYVYCSGRWHHAIHGSCGSGCDARDYVAQCFADRDVAQRAAEKMRRAASPTRDELTADVRARELSVLTGQDIYGDDDDDLGHTGCVVSPDRSPADGSVGFELRPQSPRGQKPGAYELGARLFFCDQSDEEFGSSGWYPNSPETVRENLAGWQAFASDAGPLGYDM